uniref:helix-turn-helix domain-containing protein n=1 Tax=Leucobacter sp. BZR 635 TaxID=3378705 RepID=UPI003A83CBE5
MSSASVSAAPGARRPRRRPGENRAGLIAAGTIEFGLHGYAGAQTSAIASRAGVSQPNVYANFSSKRELFLACVHELLQAVADGGTVLTGDDVRDLASPPLTQERVLLVFQAVA